MVFDCLRSDLTIYIARVIVSTVDSVCRQSMSSPPQSSECDRGVSSEWSAVPVKRKTFYLRHYYFWYQVDQVPGTYHTRYAIFRVTWHACYAVRPASRLRLELEPQLVWREREMVSSWHDLDEDVSTWQPRERRIDTACAVSRDADAVRFGGRFGWH